MKTVGLFEAKTHLSALVDEVERGERVTITKHGKPVAVIQRPGNTLAKSRNEVIDEILRLGTRRNLGKLRIRELIDEGRD